MDQAAILVSQYLASLAMLEQAVVECPEPIWNRASDRNKFWHSAYHALFFTHLYLSDSEAAFVPWSKHRDVFDFDRSEGAEPFDKESILEYLAFCRNEVKERVPRMNLAAPEGHGDSFTTMELQIYSIRHIMQHAGELMERLSHEAVDIEWVGGDEPWLKDGGRATGREG